MTSSSSYYMFKDFNFDTLFIGYKNDFFREPPTKPQRILNDYNNKDNKIHITSCHKIYFDDELEKQTRALFDFLNKEDVFYIENIDEKKLDDFIFILFIKYFLNNY